MRLFAPGLAALLLAAPAHAQNAATTARQVVQKAIDASGGAELLGKLKAGTAKIKGQMSQFGQEVEFTGDMAYEVPSRYRLTLSADIAGTKTVVEQGYAAGKLIYKLNGNDQPIDEKLKAEMGMALKLMEVQQLVPLLDASKYTVAAEKDADVDGKPAAVLLVTTKEFKDTRLFFDKGTGLLVRTERKGLAPGTGGALTDVTETTTFGDYRKIDGILLPFRAVVLHDGKKFMSFGYTEAKLTEKLDAK